MRRKTLLSLSLAAALAMAGFTLADNLAGMGMAPATPPATQPAAPPITAVDLRNTVCPVSGLPVDDSSNVVVYDGKVYHLCCPDCHKDFEKDPAKYASAVAADLAKYGIKPHG